MVAKFLKQNQQYLRWAVTLALAGELAGAVCIVRDGMVRYGVKGFSLPEALSIIRAAREAARSQATPD